MAKDWMTFYYAEPQPERFVEEVRKLAAMGILASPERAFPTIIFLSAVIAENGNRIQAWLDALLDLDPADRSAVEDAAWLSRTPEAHAYLTARGLTPKAVAQRVDPLEMKVEHPTVLDALWARYFATGDQRAVRKIVSALDYMTDFGAAKAYSATAKTDADKARAMRDAIFQAASWSLESLMREHPPLKEFCADLVRGGQLTPNERCALAIVLAKLEPTLWSVRIDSQTGTASIGWLGPKKSAPRDKPWWKLW